MAESAFQDLDSLSHLILSRNPLTELHHLDLFAARPTSVDLSSSRLQRVPNVIARYVRDLRLSGTVPLHSTLISVKFGVHDKHSTRRLNYLTVSWTIMALTELG